MNTILYIKKEQAKNAGAQFEYKIDENYPSQIDDYDFCRLLSNLLDNAINAAAKTDTAKAYIKITIEENNIKILTKNSYAADDKRKMNKSGEHGNGTIIIREIAKSYGGEYTFSVDGDFYTTCTVMKNIPKSVLSDKKADKSTPPEKRQIFSRNERNFNNSKS